MRKSPFCQPLLQISEVWNKMLAILHKFGVQFATILRNTPLANAPFSVFLILKSTRGERAWAIAIQRVLSEQKFRSEFPLHEPLLTTMAQVLPSPKNSINQNELPFHLKICHMKNCLATMGTSYAVLVLENYFRHF